jgi:hypothetical protein
MICFFTTDEFTEWVRRNFLVQTRDNKTNTVSCVTVWTSKFAVMALDGPQAGCEVGDQFLLQPLDPTDLVFSGDQPLPDWHAKVVFIEEAAHLIVLRLSKTDKFDVSNQKRFYHKLSSQESYRQQYTSFGLSTVIYGTLRSNSVLFNSIFIW